MIGVLFAMQMITSVFLVNLNVGPIPLRGFFAMASIGVAFMFEPSALKWAIRHGRVLLGIILGAAIVGFFSSALAQNPMSNTLRQILEIHVQGAICVVVAGVVLRLLGIRALVVMFVLPIVISGFFATLQFAGLDLAWQLRQMIGDLQNDPPLTRKWYDEHNRAMGLSWSPPMLGSQLMLAFAMVYVWKRTTLGRVSASSLNFTVISAVAVAGIFAIVSGNRSPLLGLMVFSALAANSSRSQYWILAAAALLVLGPAVLFLNEAMQMMGLRVTETEDGSATGRGVLSYFGVLLFLDRPIGYGLGFDSLEHWPEFWETLKDMPNAEGIQKWPIHNAPLILLNKYGAPMAVVMIGTIAVALKHWRIALGFVPYTVHILFHNDGPLQGDFFIWSIFVAAINAVNISKQNSDRTIDQYNA